MTDIELHRFTGPQDWKTWLEENHSQDKGIWIVLQKVKSPNPGIKYNEALALKNWNSTSELLTIEGSNHVFDASHPWASSTLPVALELVVQKSIDFINNFLDGIFIILEKIMIKL